MSWLDYFQSSYNYLKYQASHDFVTNLYKNYSPWTFADAITKLAEQGAAKPIESGRILDLSQFLFQPTWAELLVKIATCYQTVHIVNDPRLIKEGLKKGRSSDRYDIYRTVINQLDPHNMLLCSSADHTRLRAPFERLFSRQSIENKYLRKLARCYLSNIIFAEMSHIKGFKREIELIAIDRLTAEETNSTLKILEAASSHTTQATALFIRKLLLRNPEWMDQVRQEWVDRFGEFGEKYFKIKDVYQGPEDRLVIFIKGGVWEGENIEPSQTVQALLMEGLRLYPIVPQIPRIAKEDFQLGDTEIRAGEVVMFNMMGYQRNAQIWDEPLTFKPERFLTQDAPKILNFSHGPEQCIGKNLANFNLLLSITTFSIVSSVKNPLHRYRARACLYGDRERFEFSLDKKQFFEYYKSALSNKDENVLEKGIPDYSLAPPFIT